MAFTHEFKTEGNLNVLYLTGSLDEATNLATIEFPSHVREIVIDLKGVQSLNSPAVKIWLEWMKILSRKIEKKSFRNCPKHFVDQFNNVFGFLPLKATVLSFFVPYCSVMGSEDKEVLYSLNKEYQSDGSVSENVVVLDSSGLQMELDVSPSRYFAFLKPKPSS